MSAVSAKEESGPDRPRDPQTDRAADERAEHPRDRGLAKPALEQENKRHEHEGEGDVGSRRDRKRAEKRRRIGNRGDEEDTRAQSKLWGAPRGVPEKSAEI